MPRIVMCVRLCIWIRRMEVRPMAHMSVVVVVVGADHRLALGMREKVHDEIES